VRDHQGKKGKRGEGKENSKLGEDFLKLIRKGGEEVSRRTNTAVGMRDSSYKDEGIIRSLNHGGDGVSSQAHHNCARKTKRSRKKKRRKEKWWH